jgi:hypothetical protein
MVSYEFHVDSDGGCNVERGGGNVCSNGNGFGEGNCNIDGEGSGALGLMVAVETSRGSLPKDEAKVGITGTYLYHTTRVVSERQLLEREMYTRTFLTSHRFASALCICSSSNSWCASIASGLPTLKVTERRMRTEDTLRHHLPLCLRGTLPSLLSSCVDPRLRSLCMAYPGRKTHSPNPDVPVLTTRLSSDNDEVCW